MNDRPIAIHEAGHFVAGYRLGLEAVHISIIQDDERETLGHCRQERDEWDAKGAQDQVTAFCAGYAALVAAGFSEAEAAQGCESDFNEAEELIERWGLPTLTEQMSKTVEWMRQDANLKAVNAIALELIAKRKIPDDYAKVLVEHSDGDTSDQQLERYRAMALTG